MRLIDADKYCDLLNAYPVEKAQQNGFMTMYRDALQYTFECEVEAIPIEQLFSILPKYDDYIHTKTYPHNDTIEEIYSKGHEDGWNACLKAIKEELDYWRKENETD